ncbi:hypothetical protein NC651_026776 [Populus alba x Populus x berolinensis]|nr:hypothetical protein NC651_026776 [Populus alba x Populus x berolinensis]
MLNAQTPRAWISKELRPSADAKHVVAISINLVVGGRFSGGFSLILSTISWRTSCRILIVLLFALCSVVGMLPLSLQYGISIVGKYDWHSCFICKKTATFNYLCCPNAACGCCLSDANLAIIKAKRGFCLCCPKDLNEIGSDFYFVTLLVGYMGVSLILVLNMKLETLSGKDVCRPKVLSKTFSQFHMENFCYLYKRDEIT